MRSCAVLARILVAGALTLISGTLGAQQDYPNKPIRFITPYPPGGSTTVMARLVGQQLTESWGQQVIVENRGGGNTIIGTEALVNSPADGYTIFLCGSTLTALPHLYHTLPFDVLRDVAPVATISTSPTMLVINPSVPANNLQEFIALAKSKPGELNYATSSVGGPTHLAAALFEILAGVKMQHVPYKGAGPGLTDLIGGQVQLYFIVPVNGISHVKAGRLRALAVTGESRLTALPDLPTFAEAGLPDFNMETWYGVATTGGTPKEIIDKLSAEIGKIVAMRDIKERLESIGMRQFISTPEQLAAKIRAELAKNGEVIKIAHISIER